MPKKEVKKITSEKPVSLASLDLKEALEGLLKVKPESKKEIKEAIYIVREVFSDAGHRNYTKRSRCINSAA